MSVKVKIVAIGPCKSGKTLISNLLAEATDSATSEYKPTQGCRILEFEMNNILMLDNKTGKADIELWDCSGDRKYEACWPALAKDVCGAIMVFDPADKNQMKDLETWFSYFVENQGLRENCCMAIANYKGTNKSSGVTLGGKMSNVSVMAANMTEESDTLRQQFTLFLGTLLTSMNERRDQEERDIMNLH